MATIAWPTNAEGGPIHPEKYITGREYSQIVPLGFTAKRAPVLTRYFLWRQTVVWPNMAHGDRNRVDGFIERMEGAAGVTRAPWGFYQKQIGGASGTPTVNGAHSAGDTTVATTGWSGSDPYLRSRADMVQFEYTIGGVLVPTLHRVMSNVTAAALTMTIWPPLRFDTNNGAAIYFRGRLPPGASTGTGFLECAMAFEDPSSLQSEAFPSNPSAGSEGHYGNPGSHSFIEVVQDVY